MTLAVIRPGKHPVIRPGENTGEAARQAVRAAGFADAAAASEAVALAAAGPNYANTAAGLADTSEGDTFAVEDDGIVTVYRHDSGPTATELRVLPTTAALASTDAGKGVGMLGFKQSGTSTVAVTGQDVGKRIFHATDLGAAGDGTGDDGAILSAAIEARFGNIGVTNQSEEPVTIEFGDSRYVYNLETPIVVTQNNVRLVGRGAKLVSDGTDSAFVASGIGTSNVLYGVHIIGFVLHGTFTGDAIDLSGANSLFVADILNYADVTGAIVKLASVSSSATDHIRHPAGFGGAQIGSHAYLIHETTVETSPGTYSNCIANNHTNLLSYYATASGVLLDESNGCTVHGDFEVANGPGVDILNSVGCRVKGHFEKNGQTATYVGTDTPDDIRIRSDAGGKILTRSSRILVHDCMAGAELVVGATPNNVHIVGGDDCTISNNDLAAQVTIESGCEANRIAANIRIAGGIFDSGSRTDIFEQGKITLKQGTSARLILDSTPADGALISSADGLLRLTHVKGISGGSVAPKNFGGYIDIADANTSGAVTFGTAEPDAAYQVQLTVTEIAGGQDADSTIAWSTFPTTGGFTVKLKAAPGAGKSVRVWWWLYRVP